MYAFKNSSLTKEQLNSLGVTSSKDAHQIQIQTSLFPPLFSKPTDLKNSTKNDFETIWMNSFKQIIFDTHNSDTTSISSDSFSSKVAVALEKEHKKNLQFKFAWKQMPLELRPQSAKRKQESKNKPNVKKSKKVEKIEEKLELLEQKEKNEKDEEENKSEKDSEDEEDVEMELEEDNELDNETDYINNYFDNGEGYDDEDDDDDPVY